MQCDIADSGKFREHSVAYFLEGLLEHHDCAQASPLMDAAGFARDIVAAYREMWRKWPEQSESPPCPK